MLSVDFYTYAIGFFLQVPDYVCTYAEDISTQRSCTPEEICADESTIIDWQVDWTSDRSLNNWRVKFDLTCAPDWKVAFPGMFLFVGWTVTTLLLPPLSNIFGRKKFFAAAMILGFFINLVILITHSWTVLIIMSFCLGLLTSIRIQVGYNYMIEFIP